MRFALARKEFADLRPFFWLGVLLSVVEVVDTLFKQTDQNPFAWGESRGSFLIFQVLLAFAIGTGLLVREQDDGTLSFLDGLPITRTQMFVTKVWTALTVLMLYPTVEIAVGTVVHLVSRDSLNSPLHPHLLLTTWGLNALGGLVGLSLGTMLGYLRNLAWAAAASLATALGVLGRSMPRALMVDPTELLKTPSVGDRWPLSLEAIAVQVGISALCLLVGWRLFSGRSARLARLSEAIKRPLLSALVGLATMGALFAVVYVWDEKSGPKTPTTKDAEISGADFGQQPLSHLATQHYTFAYRGDPAAVLAASKRADALYEEIARDLPTSQTSPIDVDLTGSMANTSGTAFWNRIRIAPDTTDLVSTLAHETTHVLAKRLVIDNGHDELDHMELFNEGLAEWVEYRYAQSPDDRQADRLLASVVFLRREIAIEDLFDFTRFTQKYDRSLVYPLGSAFIEALVARYGVDTPAKILNGMGQKDFPAGLKGYALWQAAFQLAGLDLSLVVDDFWQLLGGWAKERKAQVAAFPRLRGIIEAGSTALQVRVASDKEIPKGWSTVVRFRPTSTSELRDFQAFRSVKDRVRRKRRDVAQDTVCFQPGLEGGNQRTIYESWQCVPVQWAKDDAAL